MRLSSRIWIDGGDGKTFGRGPARLLRGIEKTGSLRKAAAELGMSYNKAWWNIRTMEERLGFTLLHRSIGGTTGGGSTLTPEAADLLARFDALEQEAAATLARALREALRRLRRLGRGAARRATDAVSADAAPERHSAPASRARPPADR